MLRAISRSHRVAVLQKTILVVEQLLARFRREFEVRPLDDGVDRAGFLAHAAIDAFRHVDVVARRAARAIVAARPGLDGDRLGRADGLAKLAGDAALLAVRITAQRVLASKPRRKLTLLEGIVQRRFRLEEIAHRQEEGGNEFLEEQGFRGLVERHGKNLVFTRSRSAPTNGDDLLPRMPGPRRKWMDR